MGRKAAAGWDFSLMPPRGFSVIIYMMKIKISLGLITAIVLGAGTAFAAPAQVILIRHGEKPEVGAELNAQGFKRAQALVKFFTTEAAVTRYGTPAAIYATGPKNEDSSVRSIQTVTPLANALNIRINASFTRGQTNKIVRDLMENPAYEGRMVLISWQHKNLVEIAQNIAAYNNSPAVAIPLLWPDQSFDRVWILDLSKGKVVSFKNIPQRVLPGDSN